MIIFTTIMLLIISFAAKGIMDTSSKDGFTKSYWNKTQSWQYKYAVPLQPNPKHWYYFGIIKPGYKEKFPFSSTVLVALTDGWHLFQFIFLNTIIIALSLNITGHWFLLSFLFDCQGIIWQTVENFIVIRILYSFVFNSFYE